MSGNILRTGRDKKRESPPHGFRYGEGGHFGQNVDTPPIHCGTPIVPRVLPSSKGRGTLYLRYMLRGRRNTMDKPLSNAIKQVDS